MEARAACGAMCVCGRQVRLTHRKKERNAELLHNNTGRRKQEKKNREKSVVIRVKCSNNSCLRREQLMGRRLMTIAGIPASGNLQQTREDNWHYNHHLARARTHTHTTHLHTLTHWRDITFGTWKAETERNVHMGGGKRNRFVDGIIKDYIWDQTNWKKKRKSILSSFFFCLLMGLPFAG